MAASLDEFRKALKALGDALALPKTDITRDASIQRFEFCVELAWKTARKIMGTSSTAPKTVVREMAQNGMIDLVEPWIQAIDDRNLSSHTYNEKIADQVYDAAKAFYPLASELLKRMEKK